jgi:hypothetical protein
LAGRRLARECKKKKAAMSSTFKYGDVMLPLSPEHLGGARDDCIDYKI